MNEFISKKFRFYSFLSMILLVFVHGYNLNNRYLQPFTTVDEPLTTTTFLEYWLANGIFRFRIPLLFLISGYLFSLGDAKPHGKRMKKRLRTLLIPYLIWSAFALLLTYWWQHFAITAQAVKDAQLDQLGDNRPYSLLTWKDLLLRWTLVPIAFQLWFIRSLLVYNAAYPLILKALSRFTAVWFSVCTLLWLLTFGIPFIEGEGLLFFSLGIWMQKNAFDISAPRKQLNLRIWLPIFIVVSVLKTILAFYLQGGAASFFILSFLHKITILSGLISVWYGCDKIVSFCMKRQWFSWLCSFSFIIYAIHVPLVNYSTCLAFRYFQHIPHYRIIAFCLIPSSIILMAIFIGSILQQLTPKFYAICTGDRGL